MPFEPDSFEPDAPEPKEPSPLKKLAALGRGSPGTIFGETMRAIEAGRNALLGGKSYTDERNAIRQSEGLSLDPAERERQIIERQRQGFANEALGVVGPMKVAAPAPPMLPQATQAANAIRTKAGAIVPEVFGLGKRGKTVLAEKLGGDLPNPEEAVASGGKRLMELTNAEGKPIIRGGPLLGRQKTGQMAEEFAGVENTVGPQLEALRVKAQPNAAIQPKAAVAELRRLRNEMLPDEIVAATPELAPARGRVDAAIDAFEATFGGSPVMPLSAWSRLKTTWQEIVNKTRSGAPRVGESIDADAFLAWRDRASGVLKELEESAIESALPAAEANTFKVLKNQYAAATTGKDFAREASLAGVDRGMILPDAKDTFSRRGLMWHYAMNKILPSPQRRVGWKAERANRVENPGDPFVVRNIAGRTMPVGSLEEMLAEMLRNRSE